MFKRITAEFLVKVSQAEGNSVSLSNHLLYLLPQESIQTGPVGCCLWRERPLQHFWGFILQTPFPEGVTLPVSLSFPEGSFQLAF